MLRIEVLVGGREGVLLEKEAAGRNPQRLSRCPAAVPRHRPRLGHDPSAEDPLAPAEVHVLQIGEVVLVETAR